MPWNTLRSSRPTARQQWLQRHSSQRRQLNSPRAIRARWVLPSAVPRCRMMSNVPHVPRPGELPGERDIARINARCTQVRKATRGLGGQRQDVDRTPCRRVNQSDRGEINGVIWSKTSVKLVLYLQMCIIQDLVITGFLRFQQQFAQSNSILIFSCFTVCKWQEMLQICWKMWAIVGLVFIYVWRNSINVTRTTLACSVLSFSHPRSEGWPHHGHTFSIYWRLRKWHGFWTTWCSWRGFSGYWWNLIGRFGTCTNKRPCWDWHQQLLQLNSATVRTPVSICYSFRYLEVYPAEQVCRFWCLTQQC